MKKQRPTISISEWKLAVHLEATSKVQRDPLNPAFQCGCVECIGWLSCYEEILPVEVIRELKRVGIDLEYPTDLYKYKKSEAGSFIRVVYHVVGKILEGPNQWIDGRDGRSLCYQTMNETPFLSIVVFPQKQSFDHSPEFKPGLDGELIRIDLRLLLPSKYLN